MLKLYKFYWDCGRMGEVESLFVADEDYVKSLIGKEVYFGEILGKHSEIYGTFSEDDLQVLSDDQNFVNKVAEVFGDNLPIGHCPLSYLAE